MKNPEGPEHMDDTAYLEEVRRLAAAIVDTPDATIFDEAMDLRKRYGDAVVAKYPKGDAHSWMFCKAFHAYIGSTLPPENTDQEFLDFPGDDAVLNFARELDEAMRWGDLTQVEENMKSKYKV